MAELDQTARYALKLAPAEVIAWVLADLDADLTFASWLDTEMIAFPGEANRRCDTVAELVSRSGNSPPWALVLEVEARPRAKILARVLEYRARLLRKLRHGPRRRDSYLVAVVVFFLCGRRDNLTLQARLPGTDIGHDDRVRAICLAGQQAGTVLERIGRGELGWSVLIWVPLMAGASEAVVVKEWVRLAKEEPDAQRRSEYAGLALVFATWAGHGTIWKQALEGFNVEKISIVEEWKDSAQREAYRKSLLVVLKRRFHVEVPPDLSKTIQQTTDSSVLFQWLDEALQTESLEAFRNRILSSEKNSGNGDHEGADKQ